MKKVKIDTEKVKADVNNMSFFRAMSEKDDRYKPDYLDNLHRVNDDDKTIEKVRADFMPGDRARERVVNAAYIADAVKKLYNIFLNCTKKDIKGTTVYYRCGAARIAKSYRYAFMGDVVRMQHDGKKWNVTGITRERVNDVDTLTVIVPDALLLKIGAAYVKSYAR